jgi:hypothetical protein
MWCAMPIAAVMSESARLIVAGVPSSSGGDWIATVTTEAALIAAKPDVRFRAEADMNRLAKPAGSVANDPFRTSRLRAAHGRG